MRKPTCLLLAAVLLLSALVGCGRKQENNVFMASNEILTYQKIDPEKTQITVSRTGNIPVEPLCTAFEEGNPDIQIIYLDITGGNSLYKPMLDWAENGDLPDIVISAADFFDGETTKKYLQNLSDNPIIQNFEAAALQRTAIDANVYWLPGPSDISAMMYNKTLFDRYGWEVPATFDQFVALCDRIREDTNGEIEPWNPNAKYGNELITALEAMTYEEVFGGLENHSWYNRFLNGDATFRGHMEPYAQVLQTLIDHDILREEHFSYSATTRGKEFAAGKIAMINMSIYMPETETYAFGYMPFPTTRGTLGYLCDKYSCYLGLPVKEHTRRENDAIRRFLEYFSSAEGQQAYVGTALKVSNVKNVPFTRVEELAALQPAIDAGHMFGLMEFRDEKTGDSMANLHGLAAKMVLEGLSGEDCIAAVDERRSALPASEAATEPPEVLAVASEDFTILETSFLFADAYREAAGADIGLIAHNEAYRGNLMRIYAGDITKDMLPVFLPRSFANDSTLLKVSMTGRQIMDALNNPVGNDRIANCIYAYSGLKCEVAPWNALGAKYLSVKLADGAELEPDKLYTAAVWAGTVADAFITETLEAYEGTWEEILTAKLQAGGSIAPAKDGRIKLVWK